MHKGRDLRLHNDAPRMPDCKNRTPTFPLSPVSAFLLANRLQKDIIASMQLTARIEDATHLVLNRPLSLPRGSIVSVDIRESLALAEHENWIAASGALLEASYGSDEPDYSLYGEPLT